MRHAWVASAAFVVVMLAGCGTGAAPSPTTSPSRIGPTAYQAPSAATATPTTAAPTTSSDPALLEPATQDGWRPVPEDPLVAATQWDDVVWTGDRFLAVGEGVMIGSEDGIHWARVVPAPEAEVAAVAVTGDTVRAAGSVDGHDATWEATDGASWTRLPSPVALAGPLVAVGPRGWVRVGGLDDGGPCASYCGVTTGASWASADGITWAQSPTQATLDGADLRAVTDWHGTWLAAGTRHSAIGIWSSEDGLTWTRVRGATLRPWDRYAMAFPIGFTSLGPTLVLAGFEATQETGAVRLWWSTDGRSWTDADVEGLGEYGQLSKTWTDADGILATGWTSACRAWSTTDARTWRCIAGDERMKNLSPWGIAESRVVQVLVGMSDEGWDEESEEGPPGSIWWRPRP